MHETDYLHFPLSFVVFNSFSPSPKRTSVASPFPSVTVSFFWNDKHRKRTRQFHEQRRGSYQSFHIYDKLFAAAISIRSQNKQKRLPKRQQKQVINKNCNFINSYSLFVVQLAVMFSMLYNMSTKTRSTWSLSLCKKFNSSSYIYILLPCWNMRWSKRFRRMNSTASRSSSGMPPT